MNTQHAIARLNERLDAREAQTVGNALPILAASMPDNRAYAVLLMRVPEARGTFRIDADGTGPSNGTDLYAIIRQRTLVTLMWRRAAQPTNPENFRVDVVGKATVR